MTHTIHIIRHGHYDTSDKSPDGGALTPMGREQAKYTGEWLARLDIDNIFCSTMTRAHETAQIISQGCDFPPEHIQPTNALRETVPNIPPEMQDLVAIWRAQGKPFSDDDIKQYQQIADSAFDHFFIHTSHEQRDLLVCHGNILRYFLCKALDIDLYRWLRMDINHCGVTTLRVEQDQIHLNSHNDYQHLPINLQTR